MIYNAVGPRDTYIETKLDGQHSDASVQLRFLCRLSECLGSASVAHVAQTHTGHIQASALDTHLGHVLPHRLTGSQQIPLFCL